MFKLSRTVALAAALLLLVAACGDDAPPAAEPGVTPPADTPQEPVAAATTVSVGTTEHGDVLVDDAGMSLYLFEVDAQGESTCYDDCASAWPAFTTEGAPEAATGADAALLGTAERTDGTLQVTYDGWPLYYWAGDEAPGDTNGQGINDVWWLVAPDGTPVRAAAG